jgi:hypothetical protein
MSQSVAAVITRTCQRLVVGPPAFDPSGQATAAVVYPLFAPELAPDPPDLLTLDEARRLGLVLLDVGLVDRIEADNPLPVTVLAAESDVLLGATQARAVDFSCLVPASKRAMLPVCCVEEGRPVHHQVPLDRVDAAPWRARSFRLQELAHRGEARQPWVWDSIRTYLSTVGVQSETHDLHAVMEHSDRALAALSAWYPLQPGQVGVVCAVGAELFLELYGDPEILEDRYEQVLRSALVEATTTRTTQVLPPVAIGAFLDQLGPACRHARRLERPSLKQSSQTVAFGDATLVASALVADGSVVHLAAHRRCLGQTRSWAEGVGDLVAASRCWADTVNAHREAARRDQYARRRNRYQALKARLAAAQPALSAPTGPRATAPAPLRTRGTAASAAPNEADAKPLSPRLHRLLVGLFGAGPRPRR